MAVWGSHASGRSLLKRKHEKQEGILRQRSIRVTRKAPLRKTEIRNQAESLSFLKSAFLSTSPLNAEMGKLTVTGLPKRNWVAVKAQARKIASWKLEYTIPLFSESWFHDGIAR